MVQVTKKSLLFFLLAFFFSGTVEASDQEREVAAGDGFVITAIEMEEICKPYKSATVKLSEEQCLTLSLKTKLFAMEAERIGLSKDMTPKRPQKMSVTRMTELSDMYKGKLMDDFPLKDVVFESYYWAHPDMFREKDDSKNAGELKPLNDDARKTIRRMVLSPNVARIEKEEFLRLMESYHVKTAGGKKGAAGEKDS